MEMETGIAEQELEIEGDEQDEAEELDLSGDARTVHTDPADAQVESLYGRYKRGRLDVQPDFQRQFVWDRTKASRLIESALLSVPMPTVYLAEEADGRIAVIDGQQRLTSFFSFLDGAMPDGQVFRLSGLTVFTELNRKLFSELDETLQDRIRYYPIRTVTIKKGSDSDLKFTIFERLNTGAVPLNAMELRNCVYRGPYMALLKELAADPDFKQLLGFREPDTRMRDVELVLRFAAFYHATYLRYQSPMKRFLNREAGRHRNISRTDAEQLRRAFRNSLQIIKSLFGSNAFKRFRAGTQDDPNGYWETKRFNASLYDVLMGVFATVDRNQAYAALDSLREGLMDLMTSNQEFIDAILIGTSQVIRVQKRFDLARQLVNDVLVHHPPQPRCFSLQLKQQLYSANPTCGLCGQRILLLDDAAVDHIEQYWKGGQTIPENARLAHRFCNNSRPRND